jgi:hypothetical protein
MVEEIMVTRDGGPTELFEAQPNRDRFDDRGLTGSVFPDQKRDGGVETNVSEFADGRDVVGKTVDGGRRCRDEVDESDPMRGTRFHWVRLLI